MALPVREIQQALQKDGIDGWLLYDFHGSNPIAARITGLDGVRQDGDPALVLPRSRPTARRGDSSTRSSVTISTRFPGRSAPTPDVNSWLPGCATCSRGMKRVAMEYSPGNAIPYISRVDAGTVEAVRDARRRGGLVGRSGAAVRSGVDPRGAGHSPRRIRAALSNQGPGVRPRAAARRGRRALNEYEVQQAMVGWFAEEGLTTDDPPVRSGAGEPGNPHYQPTADSAPRDRHRRGGAAGSLGQAADARRSLC